MGGTTETDARVPGWKLVREPGRSHKYLSPDGQLIGDWAYRRVYQHYQRTGEASQSPIRATGRADRQPPKQTGTYVPYSHPESIPGLILDAPQPQQQSRHEVPPQQFDNIELPEPKLTPSGRTAQNKFSAKEISLGVQTLFILVTSILAIASHISDVQMTELEVKAIAIPLANIIERSKFNQTIGTLVVGKSDYIMLGYALYSYMDRTTTALREKRHGFQEPAGTNTAFEGAAVRGNGYTGTPGAAIKYSPSGLRGITHLP